MVIRTAWTVDHCRHHVTIRIVQTVHLYLGREEAEDVEDVVEADVEEDDVVNN